MTPPKKIIWLIIFPFYFQKRIIQALHTFYYEHITFSLRYWFSNILALGFLLLKIIEDPEELTLENSKKMDKYKHYEPLAIKGMSSNIIQSLENYPVHLWKMRVKKRNNYLNHCYENNLNLQTIERVPGTPGYTLRTFALRKERVSKFLQLSFSTFSRPTRE